MLQHAVLMFLIFVDGILPDKSLHILVYYKELLIFNMSSIYQEAYIHTFHMCRVEVGIFNCAAVQAVFGVHPVSCEVDAGDSLPRVKQPEDEDDNFPFLCQVMNGALLPSQLGFLVCCLSKAAVLCLP